MCVPSFLYVMQNSLQFVAINHLDASSFTILSQLKILTTAVCSVLMLGTHLSLRKWRALVLLVIGAILVQFPTASPTATAAAAGKRTSVTGLAAVIGMVCLSGVAGIWLEKYLKNKDAPVSSVPQAAPTLWERNLQLSLYGMLFGLASVVLNDAQTVRELGFFQSYSAWTLLVILIAAVGGLIVAVVVKYTSTIVKGFAASCSIMLTSVVSLALFPSDELGWLFWLGASCVLLSIFSQHSCTQPNSDCCIWQPLRDCRAHCLVLLAAARADFNEEDAKASSSAPVELSSMDARNGVGFGGLDKPSKQSSSPYGVTRALEQSRLENDNVSSESETSELVKNGR